MGHVRILLPQGHAGARGILEHREPALAHDLGFGRDDLPARLLDLLHVLVDRVHGDVVDHARLPVSRLQSAHTAARAARRLEQRVVNPGDLLELPSEEASVELFGFLAILHVELDVHDAPVFRWFGHVHSPWGPSKTLAYITIFGGGRRKYGRLGMFLVAGAGPCAGSWSAGPELEGGRVDAVPQARRLRTVVEHVTQVRTAIRALDLGPPHEQTAILLLDDTSLLCWCPEARPTGPRFEFGRRGKELLTAYDARVQAGIVIVPVFSREGPLGSLVDDDVVLQRRQLLPELRLVEFLHEDLRTLERFKVLAGRSHPDSGVASRHYLDLRAQGLRGEPAPPPHADRPARTVGGDDPAQNSNAVRPKPHRPRPDDLSRILDAGHLNDRLVAVLLELALAERGDRPGQFGFRHARRATVPCRISASHALPWETRRRLQGRPSRISGGVRRISTRP